MKFLIVDDEEDIRELIQVILEAHFSDIEVLNAQTIAEARERLSDNADIEYILCDYNMPDGTGGEIFLYLQKQKTQPVFILNSTEPPKNFPEFRGFEDTYYVEKPDISSDLIAILKDLSAKKGLEPTTGDYIRFRLSAVVCSFPTPCDLYLRLSSDKFVKVVNKGDTLLESEKITYNSKGIEHLFLKKSEYDLFLKEYCKHLPTVLGEDAQALDSLGAERKHVAAARVDLIVSCQETLQAAAREFKVSPELEQLVQSNVESVLHNLSENSEINTYIKLLRNSPNSYNSVHSTCLSFVSGYIAGLVGMDSKENLQALSVASFLHDVQIENNELAKVKNLTDLKSKSKLFSKEEIEQYKKHPEEVVKFTKDFVGFSETVFSILMQHHEQPDGNGFPDNLMADEVEPVSAIFIIAHDIVHGMVENMQNFSMAKYIEERQDYYRRGNYRKIMQDLVLALNS